MTFTLILSIIQFVLLLMLLKKDRDDGEKELFRRQRWTGIDAGVLILSVVLFRFLGQYAGHFSFLQQHFRHQVPVHLPHLLLFAVAWVIVRYKAGQRISDLGFRYDSYFNIVLLSTVSVLLLSLIFISLNFCRFFFVWTEYALSHLVVVPIVEETICRGVLYSPYRKKYGVLAANLITSAIFAAAHGRNSISGYVVLVAMGSLFAVLYEKKESLVYPIIAHSILCIPPLLAPFVR